MHIQTPVVAPGPIPPCQARAQGPLTGHAGLPQTSPVAEDRGSPGALRLLPRTPMQPPPESRLTPLPLQFQCGDQAWHPGGPGVGAEGTQSWGGHLRGQRWATHEPPLAHLVVSVPHTAREQVTRVTCDHRGGLGSIWGHALLPQTHTQNDTWAGGGRPPQARRPKGSERLAARLPGSPAARPRQAGGEGRRRPWLPTQVGRRPGSPWGRGARNTPDRTQGCVAGVRPATRPGRAGPPEDAK